MNSLTVNLDFDDGKITLLKNNMGPILGTVLFFKDGEQLRITNFFIKKGHRRKGYGTVLMDAMKGVARAMNLPIIVTSESTPEAITFYESVGLKHVTDFLAFRTQYNVTVDIKNWNPQSEFSKQVGEEDFLWVPSSLKEVEIYL